LRTLRDQARLSQRELGRRVAERLGRAEGAAAIRMRLARIEKGDEVSEEDRELLDALAAEFAVGVDDLAQAPYWVWIKVVRGRPGIVELAMRFPAYTSPELAYQARDWLAHASEGRFTPFQDAQLVPMRPNTLSQEVLDVNYPGLTDRERRLLVAIDSDEDTLPYLAALNEVLNTEEPEKWSLDAVVDTIDRFGLVGEIVQLHELALRRVQHSLNPDVHVPSELRLAWVRRECALNGLLELHHKLRRDRRKQTLAGVLPDE
jgi:transcriptional regulator with XRE-family HTH domain